ncbi:DNA-directed DNA polymerase [Tanacetum coccineum]
MGGYLELQAELKKIIALLRVAIGSSVGRKVLRTWMAFGGNARDLGSFGEETDKTAALHQNDDIPPWGNIKRKEKREDGPEWVVRTPSQSTPANHAEGATKKEGPEGAESSSMDEEAPWSSIFYHPSKSSNLPFPSRVKKQKKDDEDKRLLSIFKQIHINLPFLEAMIHMPKGAKKPTPKRRRPKEFHTTMSYRTLGNKNALADLGASINLMPHSLFRQLRISKLKPTRMSIQLADRSIKYPIGVCENLLVKVNKFIFPVDFVILEIDEDELVPIILRRPFLATTPAVIDVHKGKLSLRVKNKTVTFNIEKSMKSKYSRDDYLYYADHTTKLIREQWVDIVDHDGKWVEAEEDGDLNEVQAHQTTRARVEGITRTPRIRLPPGKQLTPNSHVLRVIHHRESQASEVLKNYMGSIAWSIAYIKGFDSSFSTHKILMEDEFKPSVQPQRRVNPNIKEVVKKEVIKLLDARLSYPISDSPWVRPVQVVPKKGGMTVVKNENNELIPQRTVIGWRVCINYRKLNNVT